MESENPTGYGRRFGPVYVMWQRHAASFVRVNVVLFGHSVSFELAHHRTLS